MGSEMCIRDRVCVNPVLYPVVFFVAARCDLPLFVSIVGRQVGMVSNQSRGQCVAFEMERNFQHPCVRDCVKKQ